ncbi:hypothetical protein Tco_1019953 [Tanacetum coccineum]|uniref:Uncharacterized protein n=1 Tax=Tanacetum coccineum TaxID=301880 RepID=A0ABQ5FYM3_9ASTR
MLKPNGVLGMGPRDSYLCIGCQKPSQRRAAVLGCADMKVATWDDLGGLQNSIIRGGYYHSRVRIMQISQENGQNRTNTDTGKEREYKSRGFDSKKGQKSSPIKIMRIGDAQGGAWVLVAAKMEWQREEYHS